MRQLATIVAFAAVVVVTVTNDMCEAFLMVRCKEHNVKKHPTPFFLAKQQFGTCLDTSTPTGTESGDAAKQVVAASLVTSSDDDSLSSTDGTTQDPIRDESIADTAQCLDIVRDLSGNPLPVHYFAHHLNLPNAVSYSCPERDAFRGLMSNACRVTLLPGGETVFYKRIVFQDHEHALKKVQSAPYKLNSDIQSYKVVQSFLTSQACQAVRDTAGVCIPKCYDAQLEWDDDHPIASKFTFLLQDCSPVDGWYQSWLLRDREECEATLRTLAKVHAFFWTGSNFWNQHESAAKELEAGVWKSASYVQLNRNLGQCKAVAEAWKVNRHKCEKELSSRDYWDNLGERLERVAQDVGQRAHPFAKDDALSQSYQQYRTFTHGDPKQANYLFRRGTEESGENLLQVAMIDFQWCGFGLAASDIAHCLTSAIHPDRLVGDGEVQLLRYYFDQLQRYLVEYGAFGNANDALENFSFDTFTRQYEDGVLDICRLVIAYAWARFDPVDNHNEAEYARTMNKNSYNKSRPNVVWLMSRCDEILKSRGI